MSTDTKIEWCDHTFNPWLGCARVSTGCKHCYAERIAGLFEHGLWGRMGRRKLFGNSHWNKPLAWARRAKRDGVRASVFCGSMCDVFEELHNDHPQRNDLDTARVRLWKLIEDTEVSLDWLLLTKRPDHARSLMPVSWLGGKPRPNVWIGVSIENNTTADRVHPLIRIPAAVRFVSYEPAIGPVNLGHFLQPGWPFVDWVIVGGESGHGARPFNVAWARSVMMACKRAEVACFIKQMGTRPYVLTGDSLCNDGTPPLWSYLDLKDSKGGDPSEWPEDLRVREWPRSK